MLVVGLPAGLGVGLAAGLGVGPAVGLTLGLATGLGTGLVIGFMGTVVDHSPEQSSPLDPRQTWRHDRIAAFAAGFKGQLTSKLTRELAETFAGGLAVGLADLLRAGLAVGLAGLLMVGFAVAVVSMFKVGFVFGITAGLAVALPSLLAIGVAGTATWATTLAWRQLRISGLVSAVGLMPFLEDARERGVLRTVGPIYQFRHATLQDQLANQAAPGSPAISAVARGA